MKTQKGYLDSAIIGLLMIAAFLIVQLLMPGTAKAGQLRVSIIPADSGSVVLEQTSKALEKSRTPEPD